MQENCIGNTEKVLIWMEVIILLLGWQKHQMPSRTDLHNVLFPLRLYTYIPWILRQVHVAVIRTTSKHKCQVFLQQIASILPNPHRHDHEQT